MTQQFDMNQIGALLVDVVGRLGRMEEAVSGLQATVTKMQTEQRNMWADILEIRNRVGNLEDRFVSLERKMDAGFAAMHLDIVDLQKVRHD